MLYYLFIGFFVDDVKGIEEMEIVVTLNGWEYRESLKCWNVDFSKLIFKNLLLFFFVESFFRDFENVILCCCLVGFF